MRDLGLQIGRQIDDVDGTEWAFLGTDTTADTQTFGYEGYFRVGGDFDAQLACPHHRT